MAINLELSNCCPSSAQLVAMSGPSSSMSPTVDSSAASTWVFPQSTAYAVRDYQVNICKQALVLNTLVCLPTGLGKTLIAAVVMYNYYRWFPHGKVIFLAPTKPLVNQQIAACYNIMGVPEEDIAHLEGSVAANKRANLWGDKRVFFCTPQTLMNDLANGRCDARKIVCVVIDEAHRATGQYAYTTVIQEISSINKAFRILALSATPGSDARKVQTVINNLLISHIEIRAEDDPEIAPYTHQRQIDIVVCTQGAYSGIQVVRKQLNILIQLHLDKLNRYRIVDCETAQALNVLYQKEAEAAMHTAWVDGLHELDVLYELAWAVEELGELLRCRKTLCDEGFKALLEQMQGMQSSCTERLRQGNVQAEHSVVSTEQFRYTVELISRACADPKYLEKRQPKLSKLKEILADHFGRHGRAGSSTRALVFSQLRSTVHEIKTEISEVPGIKAHEFVGQGTAKSTSTYNDTDPDYSSKGLSQADQARILRSFNEGQYNVLVATSIAEEGLDIAEVDLIVLFEAVSSPIRLVQRCGRTGRKRSGKVVMLVSQGAEEGKVEKSHDDVSVISKALRNASKSMLLYAHNPTMLPLNAPAPQMVLRDMQVATFRPGEVAGGLAQMHKSSSNNNSRNNLQEAASGRSNHMSDKAASASVSASDAKRSRVNQEQWSFNSILDGKMSASVIPSTAPTAVVHELDWFEDSAIGVQGPEQRPMDLQNVRSSSASAAAAASSPSAEDDELFNWGFTKPAQSTFLRAPVQVNQTSSAPSSSSSGGAHMRSQAITDMLNIGRQMASTTSSSSSAGAASYSRISTSANAVPVSVPAQIQRGMWAQKAKEVEIVSLLDDVSPLKPAPVQRPSIAKSTLAVLPAPVPPREQPAAAPSRPAPSTTAAITVISTVARQANPPSFTASGHGQSNSQSQSQSQSQGTAQGGMRLKNVVRSTSRSVSFFAFSDDESVSMEDSSKTTPLLVSVPVPTPIPAPVAVYMQDSPLSQVLPPVKRKIGRITETQECFGSQCSVSDMEGDTAAPRSLPPAPPVQQGGTRSVANSAIPRKDFNPFEDSGELTAASSAESESESGSDRTVDDEEADDDWRDTANACCACLDWRSEEDDPIVFCDGLCGSCIHLSCYGLLSDGVPEGDFFCESCAELQSGADRGKKTEKKHHNYRKPTCGLCFRAGGLMKRSTCGMWTHPVCVLFTPELTVCPREHRPDNVASLSKDRKFIACELCRQHGGANVQCAVTECLKAFHPYCAYTARQQMIVRLDEDENVSSYELYCPKHREKYTCSKNTGEIVSSRVSLVEDKANHADKDRKRSTKSLHSKIGIAESALKSKGRSSVNNEGRSNSNLKVGAGSANQNTPRGGGKVVRFGTADTSPGDLVDTDEKPPRHSKKRPRDQGGSSSMLELMTKSRQPSHGTSAHRDVAAGGTNTKRGSEGPDTSKRRRHRNDHVEKFFELEAALSGSDSGDESGAESSDTDSVLSGTFINDGAYTQHESQAGAETQYAMYLAVDNYHVQMASPDDFVRGKANIAALVRGPRGARAFCSPSGGSDIRDSDVSILADTPDDSSASRAAKGQSHYNDWRHYGGKAVAVTTLADTPDPDLGETASSSGESSEDEVTNNCVSAPIAPAASKNISIGGHATAPSTGATKAVIGTGKENVRHDFTRKSSFFSKLASKDAAESSEDSDLDVPPRKKPLTVAVATASASASSVHPRGASSKGSSVPSNRPPLCPVSANTNTPGISADKDETTSSPDPFGWSY